MNKSAALMALLVCTSCMGVDTDEYRDDAELPDLPDATPDVGGESAPSPTPAPSWRVELVEARIHDTDPNGGPWDAWSDPDPAVCFQVGNGEPMCSPEQPETFEPYWAHTFDGTYGPAQLTDVSLAVWDVDVSEHDFIGELLNVSIEPLGNQPETFEGGPAGGFEYLRLEVRPE